MLQLQTSMHFTAILCDIDQHKVMDVMIPCFQHFISNNTKNVVDIVVGTPESVFVEHPLTVVTAARPQAHVPTSYINLNTEYWPVLPCKAKM